MWLNAPHTPIQVENDVMNELLFIEDIDDRRYAANIYSLDREIGKIIDVIENENLLENTIILFFQTMALFLMSTQLQQL